VHPTLTLTALALVLAACGGQSVAVDSPVEHPYDGPMVVDRSPDGPPAARKAGAAGLALECEGPVYDGGAGDYADSGLESVQDDPQSALRNWMSEEFVSSLPQDGFVVERVDGDRALLSYDVDDRTKVAVIAADGIRDWNDDEGWGVESWGQCDPAELPASVTDALGITVWSDGDGERVPVDTLTSYAGPEHCDWQDITFLIFAGSTYLRDSGGELADFLQGEFDADATLPADATDTGFRNAGRELWLERDRSAAYLVAVGDRDDVERWPAERQPIGCA
jgi:hypothetical protein